MHRVCFCVCNFEKKSKEKKRKKWIIHLSVTPLQTMLLLVADGSKPQTQNTLALKMAVAAEETRLLGGSNELPSSVSSVSMDGKASWCR